MNEARDILATPACVGAWLDCVPALPADELRIRAQVVRPLSFDSPANTIVRGLMLARLRDLWCAPHLRRGLSCAQVSPCPYQALVETPAREGDGAHGSHAPHPFWLRGLPVSTHLPPAELDAAIVVVGPARAHALELELALRDALARLGSTDGSGAVLVARTERRAIELLRPARAGGRSWQVALVSPLLSELRDEDSARCPGAPWLPMLARAAARRITALSRAFAGAFLPRIAYPSVYDACVDRGGWSRWTESRFSRRQLRRHPLRGFSGAAELSGGVLEELGPLLAAAATAQLGKHTTFGFGEVWVRALPRIRP